MDRVAEEYTTDKKDGIWGGGGGGTTCMCVIWNRVIVNGSFHNLVGESLKEPTLIFIIFYFYYSWTDHKTLVIIRTSSFYRVHHENDVASWPSNYFHSTDYTLLKCAKQIQFECFFFFNNG
uniref:Uncharacterized protein n=1 Tax=Cacopsylla melanoneura TaxID=428564 RepID=A0A8D8LXB2_9HEMI